MKNRWVMIIGSVVLLAGAGIAIAQHGKGAAISKEGAQTAASVNQLLESAAKAEANGNRLEAKDAYAAIVSDYPDYDKIEEIQEKLGQLNIAIIASNIQTPQTLLHEVKPGDSLGKLAKQYGTTKELIKKSNNIKSDVIRVGQKLRIWNAPFNALVDKSQNILILKSGEEVVKIYHVSTGTNNSTPVGVFKIASKIEKPVWFKSGSAPIAAESPANELGTRWMGFDLDPHYGIHGTIKPELIGQQVTSGCVRLRNGEVEELFDIIPMGTTIKIQD